MIRGTKSIGRGVVGENTKLGSKARKSEIHSKTRYKNKQ